MALVRIMQQRHAPGDGDFSSIMTRNLENLRAERLRQVRSREEHQGLKGRSFTEEQELDLTAEYRLTKGPFRGFSLKVRGAFFEEIHGPAGVTSASSSTTAFRCSRPVSRAGGTPGQEDHCQANKTLHFEAIRCRERVDHRPPTPAT